MKAASITTATLSLCHFLVLCSGIHPVKGAALVARDNAGLPSDVTRDSKANGDFSARGRSPVQYKAPLTEPSDVVRYKKLRKSADNCFLGMCRCYVETADCSRNNGSLTFIPELPRRITRLIFSYNNLTAISSPSFFDNATQFESMDLSHNGLRYLHPAVFRKLGKLRTLILRGHGLTFSGLQPALTLVTLNTLDVSEALAPLGRFPDDLFSACPLPHLHSLAFNDSALWSVNMSVFRPLSALTQLHLGGNQLSHSFFPATLPSLEMLVVSRNGLFNLPETCDGGQGQGEGQGRSLFPRLTQLYLKNNLISALPKHVCLPELRELVLSSNMISVFRTGMFSDARFPRLSALFLDAMSTSIAAIQPRAFSNGHTENLSLMYNTIDLSVPDIHPHSFRGLPNLTRIQMGHNYVNLVTTQRFLTLFGSLTNLRKMAFGLDFVDNVTAAMFRPFWRLTHLWLYDNELSSLPDGVLDSLHSLRYLYLGGNHFNTVTQATFSPELRRRLQVVDLSGSEFQCDCGLLWFRDWLLSDAWRFRLSRYAYECQGGQGLLVQDMVLADQACLLSRPTYVFLVVTITAILSLTSVASALFRFRWHLRLMLYEAFRGHGDFRLRRLRQQRFDYDVFVSYAGSDLDWVRTRLLPELEERRGLRLCLHQRNFVPGNNIVDNIVDCVEKSKKVLMVFSNHFVRSQWCQFELALCLRYVMDHDDALIVVCLHDVASRDVTGAMMAVLKTTTYIQWQTHPEAIASFWGRLAIALRDILPRGTAQRRV